MWAFQPILGKQLKKKFGNKILKTKMYNEINKCGTILTFLALLDKSFLGKVIRVITP